MNRRLVAVFLISASLLIVALIKDKTTIAQIKAGRKMLSQKKLKYPTMLDLTFPEFEAAAKRTDVMLLPIGSIEEHGAFLPLNTDAVEANAQVFYVQKYLREKGFETILGPPLNIGITNEASDRARDGTYMYPGSLTIGKDTFVALYIDLLRSLHDNGMNRVFLYSGHLGGRHLQAIIHVAEEANKKIDGMQVYALMESERLEQMKVKPGAHVLTIEKGQNFELLTSLLGVGDEQAFSAHADGTETSLMLYFQPEAVRPDFEKVAQARSSRFFEAIFSGDPAKNPSGAGGFPFNQAAANVGKKIVDYRTPIIGNAILRVLKSK